MDFDNSFVHLSGAESTSLQKTRSSSLRSEPLTLAGVLKSTFYIFWPVYLSYLFQYIMAFISVAFMGHLSPSDLAATGLANSIITITAMGIGNGLASGFDTLGAQAYGANNCRIIGILLQKTLMILGLASCVVIALWVNMDRILLTWNEPRDVAIKTGLYLMIFIPGLLGIFLLRSFRSFIQVQGIVKPMILTFLICTILHIIFNYIFIYPLQLGLKGAALASMCSMLCMPLALFLYIVFSQLYKKTWFGFTTESFQDWTTFTKLAIIGMFSMLMKPLANETTVLLTGLVDTDTLGAQTILFQIKMITSLCSASWAISTSILVGQELGAGRSNRAQALCKYGLLVCLGIGFTLGVLVTIFGHEIGALLTNDQNVQDLISKGMPFMSLAMFLESGQVFLGYITRAVGKPHISVVSLLLGYYVIGLPLSVFLTFYMKLGLVGMWVGLSCGIFFQTTLMWFIIFFRLDFSREATLAENRVGLKTERGCNYGAMSKSTNTDGEYAEPFHEKQVLNKVSHDEYNNILQSYENNAFLSLVVKEGRQRETTCKDYLWKGLVFACGLCVLVIGILIRLTTKINS